MCNSLKKVIVCNIGLYSLLKYQKHFINTDIMAHVDPLSFRTVAPWMTTMVPRPTVSVVSPGSAHSYVLDVLPQQ